MADTKVSALQSATTPLTGEEEIYVVQGGNSRKATTGSFYIPGGTDVAVTDGGTGASDASGARTNLGLAIGSDVQAYNAGLADIAGLDKTDGNIIVGNGTNWVAESGDTARASLGVAIGTDVQAYNSNLAEISALTTTAYGRSFLTYADEAAFKAGVNLEIGVDVQAYDASLADIAGLTLTAGDVFYYNGTNIVNLGIGAEGEVLKSTSGLPAWGAAAGGGDMLASIYDPTAKAADAFNADNHVSGTTNKVFTATEQTKLAGIETGADVTDATNVAAAGAVMETDTSTASMQFVIDEDDMASDSATKVPTQQSVKAYVQIVEDWNGIESVAKYNAVADGTTDNATPFANAQAALPAEGGQIFIPPSASGYKVSGDFLLDQKNWIVGRGHGSFLIMDGGALKVDAISGPETRPFWGIEKIRVQRTGASGPAVQLLGQSGSAHAPIRAVIRDLIILGSTGGGLESKGAYDYGIYNTIIKNCQGVGLYLGMDDARTVGPNGVSIHGGEFQQNQVGVFVDTCLNVNFFGSLIQGNSQAGIDLDRSIRNFGLFGCYFEGNQNFDIRLNNGGAGSFCVKAEGCNFNDAGGNKDYAVLLPSGHNVSFDGCWFAGYTVAGIQVGATVTGYEKNNRLGDGTPAVVDTYRSGFRGDIGEKALSVNVGHDWPSLADGATDYQEFTVTGVSVGDFILTFSYGVSGLTPARGIQVTAHISGTDTITVTRTNHSGAAVDWVNATHRFVVLPKSAWGIN